MTTVYLSPIGNGTQFFDDNGVPLNGGKIYTYAAGTTTDQATYTTSAGNVQNANPIVLGSDGRPPYEIWLTTGIAYNLVLTDANGNQLDAWDNVSGINDNSGILSGTTQVVATVAALKALTAPSSALVYMTRGYLTQDDGGQGTYVWNASDTTADNGGTVIQPNSAPASGRWNLMYQGSIDIRQFGGFLSGVTGTANMAALVAAKGALTSGGKCLTIPIELPTGTFAIHNATPLAIITGLILRGKSTSDVVTGTVLTLDTAAAFANADGDYVWGWEISGLYIDYASVSGSQANTACKGITITGGTVQGASKFLVKDVLVNKPYIGFADTSTVSFGYTVENFQVTAPGNKGISLDGGGTTKRIIRPIISGQYAAGSNDGIYINGQRNASVQDAVMDSLQGRRLNIVSSSVEVDNLYDETTGTIDATSDYVLIDTSKVGIRNTQFYSPRLAAASAALIKVKGASQVMLDTVEQVSCGNTSTNTVYNVYVDSATATAATEVTLANCGTLETSPILNSGAGAFAISDTAHKVKIEKPNHRDVSAVSTSGTGEQTLITYSMPAADINDGGEIRVTVDGTVTGANAGKTLLFYLGAHSTTIYTGVNTTSDWRATIIVRATASSAQQISWTAWDGTTLHEGLDTAAIDTNNSSGITVKMTGNCTNGSDVMTQKSMLLEVL